MRRNDRDSDEQRSHDLRVTPPLEGEQTATPHVSEAHNYYPPEMNSKPLHIGPEALLVGHSAGSRHPDWWNEWSYPDYRQVQHLFRDEIEAWGDHGETRPLTDEEEDEWDEWWNTTLEKWEDRVRHVLTSTEELTLMSDHPDNEDTTVSVRVEGE